MPINDLSQATQETLNAFQKAASAPMGAEELRKAGITQSTGLTYYDLQTPSKSLFPVLTPLRNSIPRVSGNGGTATNWLAVTGINTTNIQGFVPEGRRNGVVTTTATPKSASYKSLGMEDSVSFEAELAAQGLEDERARTAMRLLWATQIEEEFAILGANYAVALGKPTAPTLNVAATGGCTGTFDVSVVPLTLQGYRASSLTGGVVGLVSVTPPDGIGAFTYGGGAGIASDATSTGSISTKIIKFSCPVVTGAVAYAWFIGTSGAQKLEAITTINTGSVTALAGTGQTLASFGGTVDYSKNLNGFDGLLYQAWTTASNSYIKNMADGTIAVGTGLTADGAGGIAEINAMFLSLWNNYKLSPTRILVNAQEASNITDKVLSAGDSTKTVARLPYVQSGDTSSGIRITALLNRFQMGTAPMVPLELHPWIPAGTLLAVTERLPYPVNGIPNVMEMKLRRDYYQVDWPIRSRQYETGVYFDGVLAHYFPPSLGIITNIANA
jgi:hypothetical protein